MDINTEAVSALSNVHQLIADKSILEAFANDGALDDRAVKCSIDDHYLHNGRRHFTALKVAATSNQYTCKYLVNT